MSKKRKLAKQARLAPATVVEAAPKSPDAHFYIALPTGYNKCAAGQRRAMVVCSQRSHRAFIGEGNTSSLTGNFNKLWTDAVNMRASVKPGGFTHFVMLHDDIIPYHEGWLGKMYDVMVANNLEVLSVMSPIKDDLGLTSTAFDTHRWRPRRLTLKEADKLPFLITNSADDMAKVRKLLGDPIGPLLINTGLMLIDLSAPWVEKLCFEFRNRIIREDGRLVAEFEPEDWRMSRDLHRWGARYGHVDARVVELGHMGAIIFVNKGGYGRLHTDEYNIPYAGKSAEVVCGDEHHPEEPRHTPAPSPPALAGEPLILVPQ